MTVEQDKAEVSAWLLRHQPDFSRVPPRVKASIYHFILVFSLFDERHLGGNGSRNDVVRFVDNLPGDADAVPFQPYLDLFDDHYIKNGRPSVHFNLLVRNDDVSAERILRVLQEQTSRPVDRIGALLFISYRLRCNLVHGTKWQTGLKGQYSNLMNAARVVMLIMDRF